MNLIKLFKKETTPNKIFEKLAKENNIELKNNESKEQKTCCFTGHRKLVNEKEIKQKLYELITKAIIKDNYTHFICGGAIGFDMLSAELILEAKSVFKDITLEIAVPCNEQDKLYSAKDKERYAYILQHADKITNVCHTFSKYCYQIRNKYMVNNSSLVIAYFDGTPSGTKNTVDYAKSKQKEIWFI